MKTNIFHLLLSAMVIMLPVQSFAQNDDPFEDDPFGAQQNSMRRAPRNQGAQWRPSSYEDQAAMLEARSKAQIKRNLTYRFETVGMAGKGDYAPFWHTSNRQGLPSTNPNNGYMHFATLGSMLLPSGFGMGYGMDLGIGAGLQSNWFVHQLYIDLDYKWLGMSIGMKERWGELKNPHLSTGGLTWSGNSQPIPQIRIGIPEYTRIPLLGSWFSVKGYAGYGRFTDDNWRKSWAEKASGTPEFIDNILFHSKAIFIKTGDTERFPLEMTLGIEMGSMFGGTLHNMTMYGQKYDEYNLPSGPRAFWEALLPFNKAGEQGWENGNTLGSWHLAFDFTRNEWHARAYYEHFFEDHSSMLGAELKTNRAGERELISYGFKRNWFDGLFGLELNLPDGYPVSNVVLEYLCTRGQCGSVCNVDAMQTERIDGRDGMYIHSKYLSYTHWGYSIGTPVLLSPIYNQSPEKLDGSIMEGNLYYRSNRVRSFHLGIDGRATEKIDYRLMATHTRHWGTYYVPFEKVENITSMLLECFYWTGDAYSWKIGLSFAFDLNDGNLMNNKGVMISLSKLWKVL